MPVNADAIGYTERAAVVLSTRWCLAYAAALGFGDAGFPDDAQDSGPDVPPCFCVGPEWVVAGGEGRIAALGVNPEERRRAVHVLQDSRYHRPFVAGREAWVTARIEEIRQTSAGTYVMTRVETRDAADDALLAVSCTAVIFRGVPVGATRPQLVRPQEHVPPRPPVVVTRWTIATDRALPHIYSECAQIWNPIHTERSAALAAGLPDIILHGTATWGLAMRQILRADARFALAQSLRRFAGRFRAAVVPGQPIHIEAGPLSADGTVLFAVTTDAGELAISHGEAQFCV